MLLCPLHVVPTVSPRPPCCVVLLAVTVRSQGDMQEYGTAPRSGRHGTAKEGSRNWALSVPSVKAPLPPPSHPLIYKLEPGKAPRLPLRVTWVNLRLDPAERGSGLPAPWQIPS